VSIKQYTREEFVKGFDIPRGGVLGMVPECGCGSVIITQTTADGKVGSNGFEMPIPAFLEFDPQKALAFVNYWIERLPAGRDVRRRRVICAKCPRCAPRLATVPIEA
jgi:hypothetical protein